MTEQNKALARRVLEEMWNERRIELVDELYAADFHGHDPANPDTMGPDGMKALVLKYLNAFPDTQFSVDQVLAEGDMVITRWTAIGTHRGELEGISPTGKAVTVPGITISRVAHGKIVEDWQVWDALGMMQQLGVIPVQAHK
jgi:steroid delta-isomerase-like uncharacterized protein